MSHPSPTISDYSDPQPQTAARPSSPKSNRKSQILPALSAFASDIKIHHTVFALPFALLSTFLASGGMPRPGILLLILICMVTARTAAMAVNRLLDARLDALNPRTARRAIPSGTLSVRFYVLATCFCSATFIGATAVFQVLYRNPWPVIFSVPVLAWLSAYPLFKRFTRLCHYWLGASLALAPVCAWIAVKGNLELPPVWMFVAVLFWTAGFDIIYACQDYAVDVRDGLYSVPARMGIARALWIARLSHIVCAAGLVLLGLSTPRFGPIYFTGVSLAIVLLIIEHTLVSEKNLSKIGLAFFTMNGILSLAIGTLGIIDVFV
ncbi:MAG TPA: 4-hydroxybenzoate octaprenyltransferase [Tepidisphaeraceae bacterium]